MEKSQDRLDVLERIKLCEKNEQWDVDVEIDPPAYELFAKDVDYLNKKISSKIATWFANKIATNFFEKLIKNGQFIIKEVKGLENFLAIKDKGAIITSNHFSPLENYAVWRTIKPHINGKRLYRVIKEGNYTNPPAPFKLIMRHCDTLPLSRNRETMKNFLKAVDILLRRGEKILVYPEQAMWWNYRKPRPMQDGAFSLALKNKAPVVPIFITMEDSDVMDGDGFPVQEYTLNILPAIYPDTSLPNGEAKEKMKQENYDAWVKTYEEFYGKPLSYGEEQ